LKQIGVQGMAGAKNKARANCQMCHLVIPRKLIGYPVNARMNHKIGGSKTYRINLGLDRCVKRARATQEFIMSVYEKIREMSDRLSRDTPRRISSRIALYSSGVVAKIKNAEYALSKIRELSSQSDNVTTSTEQDFFISEKMQFYVDSFFAFLYSAFDIISHVINQKYRMGLNEKEVSFDKVKRNLNSNPQGNNIQILFDKASKKKYFKNLDKFRNCSTHRREIYIKTTTETATPGYSTSGNIPIVRRVLCDDPLSLNPKTKQNRELVDYCTDMLDKVKSEISRMSLRI